MSLTKTDIEKVAHLARLNIDEQQTETYIHSLGNIFNLIEQMSQLNTMGVNPMAHPLNMTQPLREDAVTEPNQRESLQAIAPEVEAGLYMVPLVIE